MALRSLVLQLSLTLLTVRAVTVYNQQPIGQQLSTSLARTDAVTTASGTSSPAASSTDYKAYDITRLTPPNLPDPLPATQFPIQLQNSASNVPGLSIFQSGAFFGFSIETSVINQVCEYYNISMSILTLISSLLVGKNSYVLCILSRLTQTHSVRLSSFIQVPFLNLVSLIAQRAGRFHIRVGGNTQETARYVESTADGRMIEKQGIDPNNPVSSSSVFHEKHY